MRKDCTLAKREDGEEKEIWKMSVTEPEISGSFHSSKLSRFLGKIDQFLYVVLEDGKSNKIPIRSKTL